MDIEQLIACVQENQCLWDMKDKNYHNRDISRQKWEKVAAELNTSSEIAKTKWRGLRDTFRKELSKNPKKRSGDEGGIITQSKWAYFNSMEFLKDQFQKRQLQGNVPRLSQPTSDDEDSPNTPTSLPPDPAEDEPQSQPQTLVPPHNTRDEEATPPQTFAAPPKKITKVNNASAVKRLMKLEEEKLQIFKERNSASRSSEDPDYHFMMSLVPYLRKVPDNRKMLVRNKLQQVFCDEEEGFRAQNTTQPIHHAARTFSSLSPSDSWASGSQVQTPLSVPTHEDLASYFSTITPDIQNH